MALQRQGVIGFYAEILGQEAATIGSAAAMEPARERIEGIVGQILALAEVDDVQTSAQAIIAAMEGVLSAALLRPEPEREGFVRDIGHRIITAFSCGLSRRSCATA